MTNIFVFGSNLGGRHGKGAALAAFRSYGAVYGRGEGLWGRSYAIPTKDSKLRPLHLDEIRRHVYEFTCFAKHYHLPNPDHHTFQITRIGCGLAGFKDEEIAPLFQHAPSMNCFFDTAWRPFLGDGFNYWGSFNSSS